MFEKGLVKKLYAINKQSLFEMNVKEEKLMEIIIKNRSKK